VTHFIRAYLRASTHEQDAQRARASLDRFAHEHGVVICNYYAENESGAHLKRPELFRLLEDSRPSDVLLVEDIDRLSRLASTEWERLKGIIRERKVRIVAVNVPTTWQHLSPTLNEFDARMFGAINDMLLDMLAAIARRDYEQRRERQKQGIEKAQAAGKYRGRKIDRERYHAINRLLASGNSWNIVQRTLGCSRSTISSAIKHAARTTMPTQSTTLDGIAKKSVAIILWLLIENGSQFTRGKKAVREQITGMLLTSFQGKKVNDTETRMVIQFTDNADLKAQIDEMLAEIHQMADSRNCEITDLTLQEETTGRYWDEYHGGWK
jgi:DNA invertase Pin-like site-specific DNA recombinase